MDDLYKGYVLTYEYKNKSLPIEPKEDTPKPPDVAQKISTGAVIRGQDTEDTPVRGRTEERNTALTWRRRRHKVG